MMESDDFLDHKLPPHLNGTLVFLCLLVRTPNIKKSKLEVLVGRDIYNNKDKTSLETRWCDQKRSVR